MSNYLATIKGIELLVGSHRLMEQENISLDYLNQHYRDIKSGSNSLVYVAGNGKLLGVILYSDPPRLESKCVIEELEQAGITSYMLSGDVTRVAKAIATQLGIKPDNIYAEAFPDQSVKLKWSNHSMIVAKQLLFAVMGLTTPPPWHTLMSRFPLQEQQILPEKLPMWC